MVAHPGQVVVPLELAEAFSARCGGAALAPLIGQAVPLPSPLQLDTQLSVDSSLSVASSPVRQGSAPLAAKDLAARLMRSSLGRAGSSESCDGLLAATHARGALRCLAQSCASECHTFKATLHCAACCSCRSARRSK